MNRMHQTRRARMVGVRAFVFLLAFAAGLGVALLPRGTGGGFVWRLDSGDDASAPAQTVPDPAVVKAGYRVLLDIRRRGELGDERSDAELRAANEARAVTTRRVFPEVFRGGYLVIHSHCSVRSTERMAESASELEWARAQGQFDPDLLGQISGRFTEADADETMYVIAVGECNAQSGPLAFGSVQLAIYSGETLRASVNTLHGRTVYALQDVDDDGVDEVLLAETDYDAWPTSSIVLRLVSLKGGELRLVHDFGPVFTYQSPFSFDNVVNVPVISYLPGGPGRAPQFRVDYYRVRCYEDDGCEGWPRPDAWERVAGAKQQP